MNSNSHGAVTQPLRGQDRRWTDPRVLLALAAILFATFCLGFLFQPTSPDDDSAEAGYVRDMMQHHGQAVAMAETVRDRTDDPAVRSLAVDLELTQQAQIGQMQGWLNQWRLPATGPELDMAWMGMPVTGLMPGMATPAQLQLLTSQPPAQADTTFLRLMIVHHQAAIDMSRAILDATDRSEVRHFAQNVITAQRNEIRQLESLLRAKSQPSQPHPAMAPMEMNEHEMTSFTAGTKEVLTKSAELAPFIAGSFAAVWLLLDTLTRRRPSPGSTHFPMATFDYWRATGVCALLVSALIHAALAPEHFSEHTLYGLFFAGSTAALILIAAGLTARPSRPWVDAGVVLLIGLIFVYTLFRLVPPPAADEPEAFDLVGLVTQGIQLIGLTALLILRARAWPRVAVMPPSTLHTNRDYPTPR